MAQNKDVTQLFVELERFGVELEYEKALKTCNKILQIVPDDDAAFESKIVCQIHLSKFDEALTAINKNPGRGSDDMLFKKAYCEYRLNRTKEALRTLNSEECRQDEKCRELLGQVLYRLENYKECYDVYKNIMKNTQDEYEAERETNFSAVMAALETWGGEDIEEYGLGEGTYELCYNAACFLIGKEQYRDAYTKLQKAEELCRAYMQDDPEVTEEEVDEELAVIRVQMGYCLQKMGKSSDANKLYNQVLKMRPSDVAVTAVASNNIVTINKEQNVFDSKKKMKAATIQALQQKLISHQRESIAMNQCLLYMYGNQAEDCRRVARQLARDYPHNRTPALIEAAQWAKDKQLHKAIEVLQERLEQQSEDVNLKLTLAQLYLQLGQAYKACDVLKDLGDDSYKPGVVSALVSLYLHQEDADSASDVLNATVAWYTAHHPASPALTAMIRANATFQLTHGSPHTATDMLEQLRKRDPKDVKTLAQLISAYSKFDAKKAQAISRELPSPEQVAQAVDVDALEASVTVMGTRYVKKGIKADPTTPTPKSPGGGEKLLVKKSKKKKKGKLPKNYEEGASIDPERWLPMRERSYFRGKRKNKNKKDIAKGPQGGYNEKHMQQLDASRVASSSAAGGAAGSPGAESPRPATTPQEAGPRKQKPTGAKPKKKKKGGSKW